ncbi:MAG TPA: hypothetical protein VN688_23805, partial [Gemmataceae bacterium]|nr:hypothetical protein [Gemmataceae bacterium]
MAQLFEEEKQYLDNASRTNFVFMAYPFSPPISQDDYNAVVKELQNEYPLRLWYFLDEVTTQELLTAALETKLFVLPRTARRRRRTIESVAVSASSGPQRGQIPD